MKRSATNDSSIRQKMVEYITDKYNEPFTFIRIYGGYSGTDLHKILVRSERYPEKEICVIYDSENDVYSDNYLGIKYEEETKQYLISTLAGCFGGDVYVHYLADNLAMTENGNAGTTFNEYIRSAQSGISFTAIISTGRTEEENDVLLNDLQRSMSEAGLCCNGKIYFCDAGVKINELTDLTYFKDFIFPKKYGKCLFFIIDDDLNIVTQEWE